MLPSHENSLPFGRMHVVCLFFLKYFNQKKNHIHVCGPLDLLRLVVGALEKQVLVQQEATRNGQHPQGARMYETACFFGQKKKKKPQKSDFPEVCQHKAALFHLLPHVRYCVIAL